MTTQTAVKSVPYKGKVPFDYSPYIRKGKLPHIWCAGCGHGIVLKSLLRAIHASGLPKDDIAMVSDRVFKQDTRLCRFQHTPYPSWKGH